MGLKSSEVHPLTPKTVGEERLRRRPRRVRHLITAATLAATSFLPGAFGGLSQTVDANPTKSGFATRQEQSRSFIDRQTLSTVDTILEQSDNPERSAIESALPTGQNYLETMDVYIKSQAEKNNLTLVDRIPYWDLLKKADNAKEVLSVLNQFTNKYGFTISIPDSDNVDADIFTATSLDNLSTKNFKIGAKSFIYELSKLPIEVVRLGNFNSLKLVGDINLEKAGPDVAAVVDQTPEMYMKFESFWTNGGLFFDHELGHLVDRAIIGSQAYTDGKDPEFTAHNPKRFKYGEENTSSSVDATVSPYGSSDVAEDKATTYEKIFGSLSPDLFRNPSSSIRQKGALLVARVEQKVPGFTAYSRALSLLDNKS